MAATRVKKYMCFNLISLPYIIKMQAYSKYSRVEIQ